MTEIKLRPSFIKEIYRRTKVNFNTNKDITFKEVFNIPTEQTFYNRIFMLHIINLNQNIKENINYNVLPNHIKDNYSNNIFF